MRKLIALFALMAMISAVAPTTNVLAAGSPVGEPVTDAPDDGLDGDDDDDGDDGDDGESDETPTKPGSNNGDKSPQTGGSLAFAYIALIGAAGVSLIAGKKITE